MGDNPCGDPMTITWVPDFHYVRAYDADLLGTGSEGGSRGRIRPAEGVYCALAGPSYETLLKSACSAAWSRCRGHVHGSEPSRPCMPGCGGIPCVTNILHRDLPRTPMRMSRGRQPKPDPLRLPGSWGRQEISDESISLILKKRNGGEHTPEEIRELVWALPTIRASRPIRCRLADGVWFSA